jgi:hypothetical protein
MKKRYRRMVPTRMILLCILLLFPALSFSQTWERTFTNPRGASVAQIKEQYDHGFIIGSRIPFGSDFRIGWIIKTDINGNKLWEKFFGIGSWAWPIYGLDKTNDGGLIVTGFTDTLSIDHSKPYIIKLDACGNTEWCRIYCPGNENFDWGVKILACKDNSYTAMNYLWLNDQVNQTPWLYHVDETGTILWEQGYLQNDPYFTSFGMESLCINDQNNYMMTGSCYRPDTGNVTIKWIRPLIIMTDSTGEAVWELPWMITNNFIGEGFQTIQSGNTIYSAVSKYARYPDTTTHSAPCFLRTSSSGVPTYYRKLVDPIDYGKASTITMLTDTSLIVGEWYSASITSTPNLLAVKVDTMGIIKKEKVLSHTDIIPVDAILTHDNKYLMTSMEWIGDITAIKLWKLTSDLEYDSIYTRPFVYDSLCPHPITSSTLYFSCDVMEGIQRSAINTDRVKMTIFPNPSSDKITVKIPECIQKPTETEHFTVITVFHKWTKDLELDVYDLYGRAIEHYIVRPDEKEVKIDVSGWSQGVYLFRLSYGNTVVASEKFVKAE